MSVDLERLETLRVAAWETGRSANVILQVTRPRATYYSALDDDVPALLAECRSSRALLAKADEVITLQEALIRTFERGQAIDLAALAQSRAERDVASRQLQHQRLLAADNVRLRAVLRQIAHDPYIDQNAAAVRELARKALNPQESQ